MWRTDPMPSTRQPTLAKLNGTLEGFLSHKTLGIHLGSWYFVLLLFTCFALFFVTGLLFIHDSFWSCAVMKFLCVWTCVSLLPHVCEHVCLCLYVCVSASTSVWTCVSPLLHMWTCVFLFYTFVNMCVPASTCVSRAFSFWKLVQFILFLVCLFLFYVLLFYYF